MSEEYRYGVNAAAQLLRDTAEDYEEMAARRESQKAQLLRGQALTPAELTP